MTKAAGPEASKQDPSEFMESSAAEIVVNFKGESQTGNNGESPKLPPEIPVFSRSRNVLNYSTVYQYYWLGYGLSFLKT